MKKRILMPLLFCLSLGIACSKQEQDAGKNSGASGALKQQKSEDPVAKVTLAKMIGRWNITQSKFPGDANSIVTYGPSYHFVSETEATVTYFYAPQNYEFWSGTLETLALHQASSVATLTFSLALTVQEGGKIQAVMARNIPSCINELGAPISCPSLYLEYPSDSGEGSLSGIGMPDMDFDAEVTLSDDGNTLTLVGTVPHLKWKIDADTGERININTLILSRGSPHL